MTAALGKCLIVDDEETFLQSTAELLRREGYHCDCAPDSASATELLKNEGYDLLIADIKMPGNAELEFVKDLPQIDESIPVILVTAHPTLYTAIQSVQLNVAAYLVKPIDFNELLKQVKTSISLSHVRNLIETTSSRLESWQTDLANIEKGISSPNAGIRATSLNRYLDLNFNNTVSMLSDLKHLAESNVSDQAKDKDACHLFNCPKLSSLTEAVNDTVQVLEKTKSSFKSKDLGMLRKRLETLLRQNAE